MVFEYKREPNALTNDQRSRITFLTEVYTGGLEEEFFLQLSIVAFPLQELERNVFIFVWVGGLF